MRRIINMIEDIHIDDNFLIYVIVNKWYVNLCMIFPALQGTTYRQLRNLCYDVVQTQVG